MYIELSRRVNSESKEEYWCCLTDSWRFISFPGVLVRKWAQYSRIWIRTTLHWYGNMSPARYPQCHQDPSLYYPFDTYYFLLKILTEWFAIKKIMENWKIKENIVYHWAFLVKLSLDFVDKWTKIDSQMHLGKSLWVTGKRIELPHRNKQV